MRVPILEAREVQKTFTRKGAPPLQILDDLNLRVEEGESIVICGASGSGKTTFLNILGGLDQPTRGEVLWSGESVAGWSRRQISRQRNLKVAYVFQGYHLLPELDVRENVLLPGWIRREEDKAKAEAVLERVGLKDRITHHPYELSGGEQQRVAVARALYQDPAVILADEPTGNLDSRNSSKVVELLQELAIEKKKALVLVTHDFSIAERVGSVRYLIDGRLSDSKNQSQA
ncbi:MAG: ABC transporter ATP-binding protein [Verrucomicrobiota bacterium]